MRQNVSVGGATSSATGPFRLLLTGHAVSSLGDWVATFGLMLFVRDLTRGSSIEGLAISGILGFRILPALIAAPIASTIADRFDRRRTMIATDLVRAGLIAAVPFTPNLGAVYAIAFVLEGMSLVFLPARDAMVPNIVPQRQAGRRQRADHDPAVGDDPHRRRTRRRIRRGSRALVARADHRIPRTPTLRAPVLLRRADVPRLGVGDPRAARGDRTRRASARDVDDEGALHAIETDMVAGVRYLLEDRGRRDMILGMALATGAGGALFAIGIPYVKTTLHASDSVFGALVALWGVGMAIGAYITQQSKRRESELFRLGLGGSGLILIFMALIPHAWLAVGRLRRVRCRTVDRDGARDHDRAAHGPGRDPRTRDVGHPRPRRGSS